MSISKCISLSPENKVESTDSLFRINETGNHGTPDFPVAVYLDDITKHYVNWHWHEEFEIGFITEGTVIFGSGNIKHLLEQGDIFFVNSNVLHSMRNNNPSRKAVFKSIAFNGSIIGGNLNSIFYNKYLLPILNNDTFRECVITSDHSIHQKIFSLLSDVWDAIYAENPDYEITVRNELSNLFCHLIHLQKNMTGQTKENAHSFLQENRVQILLDYIHAHFNEKTTLDDLARAASVSKTEVLRCFKAIIGQSPINYLKTYRLQRAAYLVANTNDSIGQICEECGFNDNSYFTESFKEMYHCTPHDYRTK